MATTFIPDSVADIPEDWFFVNDSQDVNDTLAMLGLDRAVWNFGIYGGLFINMQDGEITECYAIVGSIPFKAKPVFDILEKVRNQNAGTD